METCKYCGQANGHEPSCPIIIEEGKAAAAMLEEFIEEQKAAAAADAAHGEKHRPDKGEIGQAKEIVKRFLEAQVFPKVTVPREHLKDILDNGLKELPTAYQKNVKMIVGTLSREPLLPETQDRVILEIHAAPDEVEPRFTGQDNAFQGVVRIKGPVSPKKIKVIDPKEGVEKAA